MSVTTMFEVRHGDCVALMQAMPAGSIDAVVCDPPYGLEFMGKDWDRLQGYTTDVDFKGFTLPRQRQRNIKCPECSKYIYDHPGRRCECGGVRRMQMHAQQEWHQAWATEALRVLKPGGHLLAFGGTRTYHRLVCAVEDAGFEIRDTISWLYGSGFPKSLDVGKAIDRANGRTDADQHRLAAHIRERRQMAGVSVAQMAAWFPQYKEITKNWERTDEHGARVPTLADWHVLRERLGLSDEHLPLVERVEAEREKTGEAVGYKAHYGGDEPTSRTFDLTAPATPEAERWEGWGTALKPAMEPVVVARKPLSGTVAGNVLEHGTGALNIDGTRVGSEERTNGAGALGANGIYGTMERNDSETTAAGRWPANVVLSHTEGCVQVGTRKVKGLRDWDYKSGGENTDRTQGKGRGDWQEGTTRKGYAGPDGTETVGAWSCTPDCPVRLLDEQTGESRSRSASGVQRFGRSGGIMGDVGGLRDGRPEGHDDTGGASRFFPTFKQDTLCVLCNLPLAESAGTYSPPSEPPSGTARGDAPAPRPPELEDSSPSSDTSVNTAESSSRSTSATPTAEAGGGSAPTDATGSLAEWIVQLARSAASLCDSCATATAHEVAERLRNPTGESPAGWGSTSEHNVRTLSRDLALVAAGSRSTGTTPTTATLSALCGSAVAATQRSIPTADAESDPGRIRLRYCPKSSRSERNAGLEGFEAEDGAAIRPKQRECNVCGTRAKRLGAEWPTCGHQDWRWVEDNAVGDAEGRFKGALRNSHPT